ncbi:MAG: hypothetical protein WAU78_08245 [Roseiarcus sp.]
MGDEARFSISNYRPPGPVCERFIRSECLVPFIMGPYGSGKTVAALFADLRYSALMPRCKDGVIRAKGMIVRSDYRTLYATTIPSWHSWFPADYPGSTFVGGADRPAIHTLTFVTPRGAKMELIVEFKALGGKRIEDIARGWEGSWAHIEEADLVEEGVLEYLFGRTNRYPKRKDLAGDASLRRRCSGSLNPPGSPRHWIVRRFIKKLKGDGKPAPDHEHLFIQPSGVSPQAENLANLAAGFYEDLLASLPDWDAQRFVHGKIGYARDGLPVYPDFDQRWNVAPQRLKTVPGRTIWLGLDCSGLHPAVVVVDRAPNLQVRVLKEFYFGRMGPTRFAETLAAELQTTFRDNPVERGFYDPSNDYGADKEGGEQSWIDILRRALGVPLTPAPTNEIPLRVEAVRNLLVTPIDAHSRALIVDPECTWLIEGFMADYRYKLNPDGTVQNSGNPRPEKNEHANPHDALQYACLGLQGRAGSIASAAKGMRPGSLDMRAGNTVLATDFAL